MKDAPPPLRRRTQASAGVDRSLCGLSIIWCSLCVGLVYKHGRLLGMFLVFWGSFVLAAALAVVRHRSLPTESPSTSRRALHRQNKTVVGLMACGLALYTLHKQDAYHAVSIMAGYLAFDHWFTALYCQPPPKSCWQIVEDALALTIGLVVLVVWGDTLQDYTVTVAALLVYKAACLVYNFADGQLVRIATTTRVSNTSKVAHSSHLWYIAGVPYDLHDYVQSHPGGQEAMLLGRGRDCTALFQSYHPFKNRHRVILNKHRVHNHLDQGSCPSCCTTSKSASCLPHDAFYDLLCERVAAQLEEHGLDPIRDRAASWTRWFYYAATSVGVLLSGICHSRGYVAGSFLLAIFGWLIGALGHDAGHFAASRRAWINNVGVWAMSLLCNPIMWQHQHTYAHHSFTNSFEQDPDLHHFELLLRVHRRFAAQPKYRHQRYAPFVALAYSLVVFGTCLWIPLNIMWSGSLYGMVEYTDRRRPLRAVGMVVHFACYLGWIVVWPFFVHRSTTMAALSGIVHIATSGLIFATFSQINHINEASVDESNSHDNVRWNDRSKDELVRSSWAVSQIETSNNFLPRSGLWHVLSNGLNLQIEHHLFPGLNHCHLAIISDVVAAACRDHGVRYKSYESWSAIMQSTLRWLDKLAYVDQHDNNAAPSCKMS